MNKSTELLLTNIFTLILEYFVTVGIFKLATICFNLEFSWAMGSLVFLTAVWIRLMFMKRSSK